MLDTIFRFKLDDVRIFVECKNCHAQLLLDPNRVTGLAILRCPSCSASADWDDVKQSVDIVAREISSLRENTKVDVGFCVTSVTAEGEKKGVRVVKAYRAYGG